MGEELRLNPPEQQVAVGHRQGAALPVTGRARGGPGRFGSDPQSGTIEATDRATARRHGMDMEHLSAHPHPGDQGLEGPLILTGIVGHIGRGTAHIEGDEAVEAGRGGRSGRTDDTAGRTGQNAVLALEPMGIGQPAVGLHEQQAGVAQIGRHPLDIAMQDRRQIGIHHRGVAAPDQLHQRADLVRDRDLAEADPPRQCGRQPLVFRVPIAMQEADGHRPDTRFKGRCQRRAGAFGIEGGDDLALGRDPFLHLRHPLVEQLRQHDLAGEQPGPVLIADPQCIAETAGDQQQGPVALALEECVGRDGGAHLHHRDPLDRDCLPNRYAQQLADALQGGVGVMPGVVRQQLVRHQPAIRAPGDEIGEGAPPIDPELPTALHLWRFGEGTPQFLGGRRRSGELTWHHRIHTLSTAQNHGQHTWWGKGGNKVRFGCSLVGQSAICRVRCADQRPRG